MWEHVGNLVTVPDVVGLSFHDGERIARDHGVTLANPDPDGPPIGAVTWQRLFHITDQHPVAGSVVTRHSSVVVHVVEHGAEGDRAVRSNPPVPPRGAAHATPEHEQLLDLGDGSSP